MLDKIRIFYDGTNIEKYANLPYVSGFTTNTSFMVAGKELDYSTFYQKHTTRIQNRPISMQLFRDGDEDILKDALKISSYGENVYVKIPIQKSNGATNLPVIEKVLQRGIKVNITAIFTIRQVIPLYNILKHNTNPVVVSIFAGRISDTGTNPFGTIEFACKLFRELPMVEVLWAGCKEVLSIQHAIDSGCHIITIPDSIMDRLNRLNKDLDCFSLETVQGFQNDAVQAGIII